MYLAKPRKVAPRVRMALRVAAFELLYMGAAPEVGVSQGVELVRSVARGAAGLANAVLRRVADGRKGFLDAVDAEPSERGPVSAARRAGLPVWLAREIVESRGRDAAGGLFDAQLEAAPVSVHLNPRVADTEAAASSIGASLCDLPGCLVNADGPALVAGRTLADADAAVSDLHAQLIATAATRSGSCLEIGAGRGTKTFVMASQALRVGMVRNHLALDLYERKCALNGERLHRAGLEGIGTVHGDACDLDAALADIDARAGERRTFDTVFVDAPCSGTGTMRRHPEIPWRLTPDDARRALPALQLSLLAEAASRVAPGGELVYATCSVLRAENEGVVDAFLAGGAGDGFELAPVSRSEIFGCDGFAGAATLVRPREDERGLFQTMPAPGGYDGHFCARFRRVR